MKKKLLIRASIGFLFGIAMMLVVPVLINGGPIARVIYSDALLARAGSPAAASPGSRASRAGSSAEPRAARTTSSPSSPPR